MFSYLKGTDKFNERVEKLNRLAGDITDDVYADPEAQMISHSSAQSYYDVEDQAKKLKAILDAQEKTLGTEQGQKMSIDVLRREIESRYPKAAKNVGTLEDFVNDEINRIYFNIQKEQEATSSDFTSPDDQFNLFAPSLAPPRASLQEGGLPVDDRISNLLNSLPGLMIADFVPISEKIELKRLFDRFNDRYMRKAEGGRIKFNKGSDKNNMSRRMFGKLLLGLAALPIVGRYLKLVRPAVKATEIVVNSTPGMPNFFQPLVNKVINEGIDVTKKMSTIERQTVYSSKIANHDVMVYRQLDTGEIDVYIDGPSTMYEDTVRLFYKPGEVSEEASKTAGKIVKEPDKFIAEEAAPGYEGNPFNYELNSDRSFQTDDYKKLASDLSEVEAAVLKSPVNEIQKRKKLERLNFYQSKEGTQQLLEETNPGVEDIGNSFNQSFGDLIDE
jgi:hypothetical protein